MGDAVAVPATPEDLEARTQRIGRELYADAQREGEAFVRADRWTAALFDWALGMDEGKLQLFRFVDVLPALTDDTEVVRHLREYFEGREVPFAGLLRIGLGLARTGWVGEKLVGLVLRQTVRQLARRFIAAASVDDTIRAVRTARVAGQAFTIDVLGETCVSDDEALDYQRRYLGLIDRLGVEARRWPDRPTIDRAPWGPLPRVNISVKLSALHPYLDPIDPDRSSAIARERLRPIVRAAAVQGAHIQIDMEEHQLKDLTLRIFMDLAGEEEFRASRALGIVLQAYLRDTEDDARRLVAWARDRGTPVTVRLVKGAYWDYETARARLQGWAVPVWHAKPATDAAFERLTALLLGAPDAVDLAVGSHNIRSIARALALCEHLDRPAGAVEFQTLHGMAAPLARALVARGERVRIYMPVGELIPGMGYLVRRLLENTSNESFLRRGFLEHETVETLLADPSAPSGAVRPVPAVVTSGSGAGLPPGFVNEPATDFSVAAERAGFQAALARVRSGFGRHYPLVIGGERIDTPGQLMSLTDVGHARRELRGGSGPGDRIRVRADRRGVLAKPGPAPGRASGVPGRQPLYQPFDHRRQGRAPAVRRTPAVGRGLPGGAGRTT